jgi:hypothetical protein
MDCFVASLLAMTKKRLAIFRYGRAKARLRARCRGHPRLSGGGWEDVDARDKPGHDAFRNM